MRSIPIVIHLTLHKIGFHIRFPATLTLELAIDRTHKTIVSEIPLGKEVVTINKQFKQEAVLSYDESTRLFEDKKFNIIISIKTKTSENRLTAGIVPIQLCKPSEHVNNKIAKPLRCNDPKAFLEYSLRTETAYKSQSNSESPELSGAFSSRGTKQQQTNVLQSAVHYINNHQEEVHSQNELEKYLGGSIARSGLDRRRYKSSNKLPIQSIENCEEDESKTQIISFKKDRRIPNECSLVSSQESVFDKKVKELSRKGDAMSKEVSESRLLNQNLKTENRELRTKLKRSEAELEQQSTLILNLNKKLQFKDTSSFDESRQLKAKLQESQSLLHQLMLEKNKLINDRQVKQKELLASFKEKERILIDQRKKYFTEIQIKNLEIQSLMNQRNEIQESLAHSQKMITDLILENETFENKCKELQISIQLLKTELLEKKTILANLKQDAMGKDKTIEQLKIQRKLIYELRQEKDEKDILLKQKGIIIQQLQQTIKQKEEVIKNKVNLVNNLVKQNETIKNKLKQEASSQVQLSGKVKQYEKQLKKTSQNSNKITKQIKQVESQLNELKRQSSSTIGQKSKLTIEYQRFISALKEKIEFVIEEKIDLQQKYEDLNRYLKQKQDESFDLGQQMISIKEELMNTNNEIQILREQNNYLGKSLKELSQKEQRVLRLEEKLQYNERLYEELQQRLELQKIELQNEIRLLQQKNEEKSETLNQLSDQLRTAERQQLEYQDQIQTLRIGLSNKTSQLNYFKIESERYRDNNIQFEERMAALRRTELNSTSTLQELQEENINLQRIMKENGGAIINLGKRYDSFYKSTVESLNQLLDIVNSDKKIINLSIRHEKHQISAILNDFIRILATEREANSLELSKLKKNLEGEMNSNKQHQKVIKIKTQIQSELQEEINKMKAFEQNLQNTIAKLQNDIYLNQKEIKEKSNLIEDLKSDIEKLNKQHKAEINKKDEAIKKLEEQIEKIKKSMETQVQRLNQNNEKIKVSMQNLENDLKAKIGNLNETINSLNSDLKAERDTSKQLRAKINELQSNLSKVTKQRQDLTSDIDKRTKQLITTRIQSQNRNKKIIQKQEEILNHQKKCDRLSNEKANLQEKIQKLQENNKELSIKKSENQTVIKERNNEIAVLKIRIDEVQDAKTKLNAQKEEMLKQKVNQEVLISNLNQSIRNFKDTTIKNEETIKKITFDKDCSEKDWNKKLNVLTNEKNSLEKQLNEYKLKVSQKQAEQSSKQKALANQLRTSKIKLGEYTATIDQLKKQIENNNTKMNSLLSEFNAKAAQFQSKQTNLLPNSSKIKEIMQSVAELRSISKEYQSSKNKLLRLTNQTNAREKDSNDYACEIVRELNISINKLKIQILNKLNVTKEIKTVLLDGLKNLQVSIEKLERSA